MAESSYHEILKEMLEAQVDFRRKAHKSSAMKYFCFEELVLTYGQLMTNTLTGDALQLFYCTTSQSLSRGKLNCDRKY
jgi:hypothetical protein